MKLKRLFVVNAGPLLAGFCLSPQTARFWRTNGTARKTGTCRPSLRSHRRSFRIRTLWGISIACSNVQLFVDVLHCQLALTGNAQPKVEESLNRLFFPANQNLIFSGIHNELYYDL